MKIKNKKVILVLTIILSIVAVILVIAYGFVFHKNYTRKDFAKSYLEVYERNEKQVFKVEKIILCSSANAINVSNVENKQTLNVYQYTDLAIHIDNGDELTNENTVKDLYIDNISFEGSNNAKGSKSLVYKNLLNFGLKEKIEFNRKTKDIKFNVAKTNEEDENANYDDPTFYTDCSNPISLEYLNYNLVQGYEMEENNQVAFDGSLLERVGLTKDDISCKLKFKINIINNKDEKFSCWININLPLDDISEGTTMKQMTAKEGELIFFKE